MKRRPVTWNAAALRILAPAALREEIERSRPSFSEEVELREALRRNPQLLLRDPASGAGGTQEMEVARDDGSLMPAQVTRVPFEVRPQIMGTLLLVRDLATLRKVEGHLLEAGRYAVLAHLAAHGVLTVDSNADTLHPRLIGTYLELKERGRV